jgi:IS6 family transposase
MRGLKRFRSAQTLAAGHSFIQNLRRGHYAIVTEEPVHHRLGIAFNALAALI